MTLVLRMSQMMSWIFVSWSNSYQVYASGLYAYYYLLSVFEGRARRVWKADTYSHFKKAEIARDSTGAKQYNSKGSLHYRFICKKWAYTSIATDISMANLNLKQPINLEILQSQLFEHVQTIQHIIFAITYKDAHLRHLHLHCSWRNMPVVAPIIEQSFMLTCWYGLQEGVALTLLWKIPSCATSFRRSTKVSSFHANMLYLPIQRHSLNFAMKRFQQSWRATKEQYILHLMPGPQATCFHSSVSLHIDV